MLLGEFEVDMMIRFGALAGAVVSLMNSVDAQNAFAGAVGFGALATGGNGGTTYHVTTLADSGAGSFVSD